MSFHKIQKLCPYPPRGPLHCLNEPDRCYHCRGVMKKCGRTMSEYYPATKPKKKK